MGIPTTIQVTRDEKRGGFFVNGSGFDFYAHYTADMDEEGRLGQSFIECDNVSREDDPTYRHHLQIKLGPGGHVSDDVIETALTKWITERWPDG